MMMQELKGLEQKHPEYIASDSPTQKVGGSAKREAGVLVRHNVPMLSLQDVFSKEDVDAFVADMQEQLVDPTFVVEYKIDGLSMALRYVNGKLDVAVTRGDGVLQGDWSSDVCSSDLNQHRCVRNDRKQRSWNRSDASDQARR